MAPGILADENRVIPDPGLIPASDAKHENAWYNQDFEGYRITEQPLFTKRRIRLVCVGAGAAGLQIAYKAERLLENVDLQLYEKRSEIGGCWLANRYPGCACDIPSHSYQYTWARNPKWSHYYASATEIWQYFKDVATKFNIEKHIQFNTSVESATWDEASGTYKLDLINPEGQHVEDWCDVLISASGLLHSWKYPNIPGLDQFQGKLMHSADWDDSYDLSGKTVAVIGGGSSAVQLIPNIQDKVGNLIAFIRSPTWITTGFAAKHAAPGGLNFAYTEEQMKTFAEDPVAYEKYCRDIEGELNKRFNLMHLNSNDQKTSCKNIADTMTSRLKNDELAKRLIPNFALGCRRMTPGPGFLEALSQDNVKAVWDTAARLTETGIIDGSGVEHKVDVVICATGFDTSFAPHFTVTGRNDADLRKQFGDFPKGYLGIAVQNFPNFFVLPGPSSPTSHGSFLPTLEWYTRYMFMVINKVQTDNIKSFEPKEGAIKDLYNHTHELMKRLAWSSACRSWFKHGKENGPVTAVYPGSRLHFFEMLKNVRWEDFDLTYKTENRFQFMGNGFTQLECSADGDPVWYFDDPFVRA